MLGTRFIIIVEKKNIAENNNEIETKNRNVAENNNGTTNYMEHNTKIIPLLIGNNVHFPLRGATSSREELYCNNFHDNFSCP
jgi:hypothetical protein